MNTELEWEEEQVLEKTPEELPEEELDVESGEETEEGSF